MSHQKPNPSRSEVETWLSAHHGAAIEAVRAVSGGFWSSAFSYRAGGQDWILRVSDMREGFDADRAAMRFTSEALPVPEVVDVGRGFGGYTAISRRHFGRFVEHIPVSEAADVGAGMAGLLAALRSVGPVDAVEWAAGSPREPSTWHAWLRAGITDSAGDRTGGWRAKLAADPTLDALFERCVARIEELLPHCPERRDLVHGDLLHQNVLVADDDASQVTAIFSWKCSAGGDFLYDVAWCTFWSPWHPAIAEADLWARTLEADDLEAGDRVDAELRHHCYELQIAASHLGWLAWTGDDAELARLARETDGVLARGPRRG